MTAPKQKKPRRSRAKGSMRPTSTPRKGPSSIQAHVPTAESRESVAAMASFGSKHEVIAKVIGVSPDTLRRHYADELDGGKGLVDAKVGSTLARKAIAGETAFTIFYAKTRMGLRETDEAAATTVNLTITRAPPPEPAVTEPPAAGGEPSTSGGAA